MPHLRSASSQIDTGVRVGPYLVERRFGGGGARVGTVYLARDSTGERVVLRVLQRDAATTAIRARMRRKARALASIDHPGLEHVHGIGEHGGMFWVAVGFVQGTPVESLLAERGPLSIDMALRHTIQAAEALSAAHDAGVIHAEIESGKLLIAPDGRIVVVGFGVATRTDRTAQPLAGGGLAGPSAYAAPEQIEHGLADERSDVWALGCALYEMVVGSPPFGPGGAETAAAILRDEPVFPAHVAPAIVHIVNACVRKNSFARIATSRELLVLLRDAVGDPRSETVSVPQRASARPSAPPAPLDSRTIPPPPRLPSMPFRSSSGRSSAAATSKPPSSATRMAAPRGRIKGAAMRAGVAWFAEAYGPPALARVMELASPELRAVLRPHLPVFGLIASGWYDTQVAGELIELIERVACPMDPVAFRSSVGEAIAHENVGGAHRALFRLVASPSLLEANAQRVWRTYVDEGTLSVRPGAPGSFDARVRGWSRHHPSVCRTLRAMLESALSSVGYTALVLERTHCVALGDTQCTFAGAWSV